MYILVQKVASGDKDLGQSWCLVEKGASIVFLWLAAAFKISSSFVFHIYVTLTTDIGDVETLHIGDKIGYFSMDQWIQELIVKINKHTN